MRAIVLQGFESVPTLTELPEPEPGAGDVLIRVLGSSVNALDLAIASGTMRESIKHDFPLVLGRDFSGTIHKVGPDVMDWAEGDETFGFIALPRLQGTWADYVGYPANSLIAPKPINLDFVQAGVLPLAGLTGTLAVEAVAPKAGDFLLIVGATGGVGSYATQLATSMGAKVIATAKPDEEQYVRSLGALETIDYTSEDVAEGVRERHPEGIQGLIDLVNRAPEGFVALAESVLEGGGVASSLGAADVDALAARNVRATNLASSEADPSVLHRLGRFVEEAKIKPPIAHVYSLEEAPQALEDFKKGTLGKLAVALG